MPRVDYATYKATSEKVIVSLSKQHASALTRKAKLYKEVQAELAEINDLKRLITTKQKLANDKLDDANSGLKELLPELVDENEKLLTITVECLGSSFTLSKFAESNKDKVINKAGDIISTDYKAIVEQLIIQGGEISAACKLLIKQFSVVAESDVIKPGAERRLTINVESIVQEGVWDKVKSIINKLSAKFKSLFSGLRSRQNKINSMLSKLNESNNKGKIMLNKSEKQLVKEYANKLIEKRKMNEDVQIPSNVSDILRDIGIKKTTVTNYRVIDKKHVVEFNVEYLDLSLNQIKQHKITDLVIMSGKTGEISFRV